MLVTFMNVAHFLPADRYYSYCRCLSEHLNAKRYLWYLWVLTSFWIFAIPYRLLDFFFSPTWKCIRSKPMTWCSKIEHWISHLTKEFYTFIRTNSEPQNSAVKDPFRIVQTMSNQRKACGKQVNEKSFSLSFCPHNFHFPKSTRTSVHTPPCCWQGTGRSTRRRLPSRCQLTHTIASTVTPPAPRDWMWYCKAFA